MEKIARWSDASLLPERGLTLSPAVDANLRDRIRSLLVSRNRRNPPKTPCPSPDHNHARRASEENRPDNHLLHTKDYKLRPTQTSARLTQLENRSSDMGATRFDGPAGQVEDHGGDALARRPSQPGTQLDRKLSEDWQWSAHIVGLNQRAHGDTLGREVSIPSVLERKISSASKKSTGSRIPRFYLRTVPPAKDVNKTLRPSLLHVPGSYQSETDTKKDHDSHIITTPPPEGRQEALNGGILAVPYHAGLPDEHSHQAAIDALRDVAKHDRHQDPQLVNIAPNAPSHKTLKPIANIEQAQGVPQNLSTYQTVSDRAAETTVPSTYIPERADDEGSNAPVFVIGEDHEEIPEVSGYFAPQDDIKRVKEQAPLLNGPRISDLLAGLPPTRQATSKDIDDHHLLRGSIANLERTRSSSGFSLESSLHSVVLDQDGGATSPVSPLLPKSVELQNPVEAAEDRDEATVPLIAETRRSSQVTARVSPVSRAMSMLSEVSARSGIKAPSLRSSAKYEKLDSTPNLITKRSPRSRGRGTETSPVVEDNQTLTGPETTDKGGTLDTPPQQNHGEGFSKAITDLESVLQEALSIAGEAGFSNTSRARPDHFQAQGRGYSRAYTGASASDSGSLSSLSEGADEEDNHTRLPQQGSSHGKGYTLVKEPENETPLNGRSGKVHDANPYSAQTMHASIVPALDHAKSRHNSQSTNKQVLEIPRTSSMAFHPDRVVRQRQSYHSTDIDKISIPSRPSKLRLELKPPPSKPQPPATVQAPSKEQHSFLVRDHGDSEDATTRTQIRDYVNSHQRPPIQARTSSRHLKAKKSLGRAPKPEELNLPDEPTKDDTDSDCECVPYVADFKTSGLRYHPVFQDAIGSKSSQPPRHGPYSFRPPQDTLTSIRDDRPQRQEASHHGEAPPTTNTYSLEGRHHFSVREPRGFSLSRSHRRSPIARDWSTLRKRFTATVACITTAFMGLIVGIYAGEVPAIQYAIADEHHYTILGNVFFFIGLAITTALFYPLPLLHGRKPYTLAALAILLPLWFPQALAINQNRSPYVATYRVGLLVPRVFAGVFMGFANINFITTLLDLFGASLQSGNPHQESVNENDVRRHGGGMGVWLGIWTWCAIGSLGLGFLIGAGIISGLDVSWGFWILIILNAAVLLLNIVTPEVRRSAYRRSMAEVRNGEDVSRRVARGEIKMHLESTGPIWWGEEVIAGHVLAIRMLKQPGFALLALYQGWIYGQVVLVIVVSRPCLTSYFYAHR